MFFQVSQNISRNSSAWKAIQEPGVSEEIPRIAVYLLLCIIFLGPGKWSSLERVTSGKTSVQMNPAAKSMPRKQERKTWPMQQARSWWEAVQGSVPAHWLASGRQPQSFLEKKLNSHAHLSKQPTLWQGGNCFLSGHHTSTVLLRIALQPTKTWHILWDPVRFLEKNLPETSFLPSCSVALSQHLSLEDREHL